MNIRRLDVYDESVKRRQPGEIRDAIYKVLGSTRELTTTEIVQGVRAYLGDEHAPESSVRSYLALNATSQFKRTSRGRYRVANSLVNEATENAQYRPSFAVGQAELFQGDCLEWLRNRAEESITSVVTDPPYGLTEYSKTEQEKLRAQKGGGVWRIPPSYDGSARSPVPRFTIMNNTALRELHDFFETWAELLLPALVPGAHVIVACNPLVSPYISMALADAGLERRGEIVRRVMTMRGGDRPKGAHEEFPDVSVMPRSQWEPWLVYRKPIACRTVADNLRKYKAGGLRRISDAQPFGDVIISHPTNAREKKLANHPSLKPQSFLRQVVRASLPLGEGVVCDPFAGSGSTLAAAEAVGYSSVGVELDQHYVDLARLAIPKLAELSVKENPELHIA